MFNMIKADLYRIVKGKAIYIALIVMLALVWFSSFAMEAGHIGLTTSLAPSADISHEELTQRLEDVDSLLETRKIMKEYGSYPLDKSILSTNVNLYYIFIVIVVIVLVTDLSNSTAKNTLSSSVSRRKYYFSKLVTAFLLGTLFLLVNNYSAYFINFIMNGKAFTSGLLEITKITLLQLPIMYGIISLLVCFGFCFKKTAVFNGVAIPFIMVFQLVLMGIASLFHLESTMILNYEFQYVLTNLAMSPTTTYIINSILLGVCYIVIFNFIGYNLFKKAEIK